MAGENPQTPATPPAGTPPPATPPAGAPSAPPAATPPAAPAGTLLGGNDQPPAGEQPPAGGPAPAPADVDLKLPAGFDDNAPILGEFKGVAKELGLDSAKAQKVFDVYVKAQTEAQARAESEFKATREQWTADMRKDPEIGGAKWDATVTAARLGMQQFCSPELKKWIGDAGLADFPPLVKLFAKVGAAMADDSIAGGEGGGGSPKKKIETYEDLGKALGY